MKSRLKVTLTGVLPFRARLVCAVPVKLKEPLKELVSPSSSSLAE